MLAPIPFLLAAAAATAQPVFPVIAGHGGVIVDPAAKNRPDPKLRYRVVFSVTTANDPGKPNMGLEKVARLLNLLGADQIRPQAGDIVPIVHAGATASILSAKAYATRHAGAANPDADLIAKLAAAGQPVHVCSQALRAFKIADDEVDPNVVIDDSALTTIATLQLRGYALIAD